MSKRKLTVALLGLFICSLLIIVPIQPAKAQFVLSYDYDPTNEGNYIAYITAYVDSVVNGTVYFNPVSYPSDTAEQPKEIQAGVNLTLAVFCWVNGTRTGISSVNEGLNIMRHNVTVTCINGTVVFSQNNFTFIVGSDGGAPMYFYRHDVILDFVPIASEIYIVTITYEVFY